MKTSTNDLTIPQTIINQFGIGFVSLTGAHCFVWDPHNRILSFHIGRNPMRINTIRIQIVDDLYNVEFGRNTPRGGYKGITTLEGIYCDSLAEVFESRTGLIPNFLKR